MNPNSQKFRIAIIGAGPIGLYLAWKLSEAGHKVTIFEKNSKIENKVCSGLISERLKSFIPINESLIENRINSSLVYFPKRIVTLNFKLNFLVINRQKLNEKLYNLAQKSGAEILFSQFIKEIPQGFDKVIGCDGALSQTRELLGLPQPFLRLGLQIFLPIKDSTDYVETWPIKGGFLWKIPRNYQTEYGALGPLNSIEREFKKFCQSQKIDFSQADLKSALIPQGLILPKNNLRPELKLRENITLCGDAAGLTKPWSGGGIIWGLIAANFLIENFPNFEKYHRKIKAFFGPKIFLGNLSKKLFYFGSEKLSFFMPTRVSIDNDFLLG